MVKNLFKFYLISPAMDAQSKLEQSVLRMMMILNVEQQQFHQNFKFRQEPPKKC